MLIFNTKTFVVCDKICIFVLHNQVKINAFTMAKIAIKIENQGENLLLPPSLDELIPATHTVRVVNDIINTLDITEILSSYRGGGNSCFSPRTMIKILVYAYLNNIYSSRRIAQQLCENINYMWLSGGIKPDFRTINYFRGKRLKQGFDKLFTQVVELLHSEGFVSLKVQYIDGTKLESMAGKYTFVWRGSVEKNDAKLKDKVNNILSQIENNINIDNNENPPLESVTADDFKERVKKNKVYHFRKQHIKTRAQSYRRNRKRIYSKYV